MAFNVDNQQYLLYFYELPKDTVTSVKISEIIKEKTGLVVKCPAQFKRDIARYFDSCIVKIDKQDNPEIFKEACQKLKYFEIDGKPCRCLPFDKEIIGQNKQKLKDKNVFVRSIPKTYKSADLDTHFQEFGRVKSAKISINKDHESNGYGFVCFEQEEDSKKAINHTADNTEIKGVEFQVKDKKDMQKAFNNLYVKNFPKEWDEGKLKDLFSQYGTISSIMRKENEAGAFAFICYETHSDKSGFQSAMNAVKELNEKRIDDKNVLYVKQALSKADREIEKKKNMIRYKNSKKRCNLYVKNFPPNTTLEQLTEFFKQAGDIESIKMFPNNEEPVYAFVCYKSPESASNAKNTLSTQ